MEKTKKNSKSWGHFTKIEKRMRKRDLGPNYALALPTAAKSGEIEP